MAPPPPVHFTRHVGLMVSLRTNDPTTRSCMAPHVDAIVFRYTLKQMRMRSCVLLWTGAMITLAGIHTWNAPQPMLPTRGWIGTEQTNHLPTIRQTKRGLHSSHLGN